MKNELTPHHIWPVVALGLIAFGLWHIGSAKKIVKGGLNLGGQIVEGADLINGKPDPQSDKSMTTNLMPNLGNPSGISTYNLISDRDFPLFDPTLAGSSSGQNYNASVGSNIRPAYTDAELSLTNAGLLAAYNEGADS